MRPLRNISIAAAMVATLICASVRAGDGAKVINVEVVDSVSHKRVTDAEVWWRPVGEIYWGKSQVATNGILPLTVGNAAELELIVQSSNYPTYRSPKLQVASLKGRFEVQMFNSGEIRGKLHAPYPELARVFFIAPTMQGGIEFNDDARRTRYRSCDSDGTFRIDPWAGATALVFVHDFGLACVPLVACGEDVEVTLQPWQRLRGTLLKNGKPAAKEKVTATRVQLPFATVPLDSHCFTVETDKDGRFVFERIPAGQVELVALEQIKRPFTVQQGLTTEIVFDCRGKEVAGRLRYSQALDWAPEHTTAGLMREPTGLELNLGLDLPPTDEECQRNYYQLDVAPDGTFARALIPVGDYTVVVSNDTDPNHWLNLNAKIRVLDVEEPQRFEIVLRDEEAGAAKSN